MAGRFARAAGMYSKAAGQKIGKVMREGMAGKLRSGAGGPIVKQPAQMKAIALSSARQRGMKVPPKPGVGALGKGKGRLFGRGKVGGFGRGLEQRLAGKKF